MADHPTTELGDLANEGRVVDKTLQMIDDLLDNPDAQFAADTLRGISATITQTHRVTAGQVTAIRNISGAVTRKQIDRDDRRHARTSRRYEGFGR